MFFFLFYCEMYIVLREKKKKKLFSVNKSKNKVITCVLKMENRYIGSKILKELTQDSYSYI